MTYGGAKKCSTSHNDTLHHTISPIGILCFDAIYGLYHIIACLICALAAAVHHGNGVDALPTTPPDFVLIQPQSPASTPSFYYQRSTMLTANSPLWQHLVQNAALLALSLFLLPLSTFILLASLSFRPVFLLQELLSDVPRLQEKALERSRPLYEQILHVTRDPQQLWPSRLLGSSHAPSKAPPVRTAPYSSSFSTTERSKTILITGLSMTKALTLTRYFHLAGHRVVGADTQRFPNGRVSQGIKAFYVLPPPNEVNGNAAYISRLLQIIVREEVDLWVPCSGVSSEIDDGAARDVILRRTSCKVMQLGASLTSAMHEKDSFIQKCKELGLGSAVPETYNVTSRDSIHRVLHSSSSSPLPPSTPPSNKSTNMTTTTPSPSSPQLRRKRKHYILKPTGVDDASRSNLTLLPRRTPSATYDHVAALQISRQQPFILQQFVPGKEYCTHALVVRGEVKAFTACESSAMLMHYTPLPASDPLGKAMEQFTKTFAARLQEQERANNQWEVTAHLSFDFLASESIEPDGGAVTWELKCIECNPRPHTAVVLFKGREREMAEAYLAALDEPLKTRGGGAGNAVTSTKMNGHASSSSIAASDQNLAKVTAKGPASLYTDDDDEDVTTLGAEGHAHSTTIHPLPGTRSVYWLPHDVVTLLLLPSLQLLYTLLLSFPQSSTFHSFLRGSSAGAPSHQPHRPWLVLECWITFLTHILLYRDGTFDIRDPWPAWWLWSVQIPGLFLGCLWRLLRTGVVDGREGGRGGGWSGVNVSTGKVFSV